MSSRFGVESEVSSVEHMHLRSRYVLAIALRLAGRAKPSSTSGQADNYEGSPDWPHPFADVYCGIIPIVPSHVSTN